jgi:hypothetical protein
MAGSGLPTGPDPAASMASAPVAGMAGRTPLSQPHGARVSAAPAATAANASGARHPPEPSTSARTGAAISGSSEGAVSIPAPHTAPEASARSILGPSRSSRSASHALASINGTPRFSRTTSVQSQIPGSHKA